MKLRTSRMDDAKTTMNWLLKDFKLDKDNTELEQALIKRADARDATSFDLAVAKAEQMQNKLY